MAVELGVWTLVALLLWLGLSLMLEALRVPWPYAIAAVVAWVLAGLSLPWTLPVAVHWAGAWLAIPHALLTMH
jgi:hypothetical protein